MVLAFALANSPLRGGYEVIHHLPVALQVGDFAVSRPLILWVNDGLMVFFFLLIGLELKGEVLDGHLASRKALMAPLAAALGGMAIPALIYAAFNWGAPATVRGWPVPAATDIVLVLALLTLAGKAVPPSLKVFVVALATFDDLGAIAIIAVYFAEGLSGPAVALAGTAILALIFLNVRGVTRPAAYSVAGAVLWIALSRSGVHATLAGVLVGLAVPLRVGHGNGALSPLRRMEATLRPWVSLGIVPVFAFLNSGIPLAGDTLSVLASRPSMGIVLGLFIGKQIGVFGALWIAVRLRLARLPEGVGWRAVYGSAVISGVGFTMSILIAGLAFPDPAQFRDARLAVIVGSLLSATLGVMLLRWTPPQPSLDLPPES